MCPLAPKPLLSSPRIRGGDENKHAAVGGGHHTLGPVQCDNCKLLTKESFLSQGHAKEKANVHWRWDDAAQDKAFFCPECQGYLRIG